MQAIYRMKGTGYSQSVKVEFSFKVCYIKSEKIRHREIEIWIKYLQKIREFSSKNQCFQLFMVIVMVIINHHLFSIKKRLFNQQNVQFTSLNLNLNLYFRILETYISAISYIYSLKF